MRLKSNRARSRIFLLCLGAVFVFAAAGRAAQDQEGGKSWPSVGFKLSGGLGLTLNGGGDLEKYRQGTVDLYKAIGTAGGFTSHQSWNRMGSIPDFEFDVIFQLSEHWGVGIGTGYLKASSRGDYGSAWQQAGTESWGTYTLSGITSVVEDFKITAIPIRLSLYLMFPTGRWTFYGYAGTGYYIGKYSHAYTNGFSLNIADSSPNDLDEKQEITQAQVWNESAAKNAFGFHGGLGLEYKLGSFLSLGLEVYGRYVNFSGWEGDAAATWTTREKQWREDLGWHYDQTSTDSYSVKGKLWYYEYQESDLNAYYPQMGIWGYTPDESTFRNVRDAAINLNAFGLSVSIKIFFNL